MPIPALEVACITRTSEFHDLRDEWNLLNDRSTKGTLFSSWEWLFTWWEIYRTQADRELFILCCRSAGKIVGIAPFQILNHPRKHYPCSKRLLLLGTGETDGAAVFTEYLDLLIEPGSEREVIRAFSQALSEEQSKWQGAHFQQLLEGAHLSRLFSGNAASIDSLVRENGFRVVVDLPESFQAYLMSLRKKMRNNFTRLRSRLNSEREFRVDCLSDGLDVDQALCQLAKLNRERRENLEVASAFHCPNFEAYHRKVVKRLLPLRKVEIRIMRFGQIPVAAFYTLIDRTTVHAYQSGFEEEMGHRYGLMTQMIVREISSCIDDPKISRFNFMYSEDESSYKLRYGALTEPMFDISHYPKNMRARVHQLIHGPVKRRVKSLLRKSHA